MFKFQLIILLCIGITIICDAVKDDEWQLRALHPTKNCKTNCSGRRTRARCSDLKCVLMEDFLNCSYPQVCATPGGFLRHDDDVCTGPCNNGLVTRSVACASNPGCRLERTYRCEDSARCTSSWTGWSDVTNRCGGCDGWKITTRSCRAADGSLSDLCSGSGRIHIQRRNITCKSPDCDVTKRSDKLGCQCSNIVTSQEDCKASSRLFYSFDCSSSSKTFYPSMDSVQSSSEVGPKWTDWKKHEKVEYRKTTTNKECKIFVQIRCPETEPEGGLNPWVIFTAVILAIALCFGLLLVWKYKQKQRKQKSKSNSKTEEEEFSGFNPPPSARVSFIVTSAEGKETLQDVFQPASKLEPQPAPRTRFPTPLHQLAATTTEGSSRALVTTRTQTAARDYAPSVHYKSPRTLPLKHSHKYDEVPRHNTDDVIYSQVRTEEPMFETTPATMTSPSYLKPMDGAQHRHQYVDMNGQRRSEVVMKSSPYYSTVGKYLSSDEINTGSIVGTSTTTPASSAARGGGDYIYLHGDDRK